MVAGVTVYRRKDRGGAWAYEFVLGGVRYRAMALGPDNKPARTKGEALAAEIQAKAAARQEGHLRASGIKPGTYAIAQAATLYMRRKAGRTAAHVRNAQLYASEILAFFGPTTPLVEIGDDQVEAYRDYCGRQTLKKWRGGKRTKAQADPADPKNWHDTGRRRSKRTVNNYLKALRQIFAIADRVRDPTTRRPVIDRIPEIRLHKLPRRLPRPMPDQELEARLATAPPWTIETAELARLFGLRKSEALKVERRHVDREARGLRFRAGETKSGNDEYAFGGDAGWQLLERLDRQAADRRQVRLITWPGPKHAHAWRAGGKVPADCWRPLKAITTSWRRSAERAGLEDPHRFHDVRARYVTEVAKVQQAAAQGAARHQDPATTALYIRLAETEIAQAVDAATRTAFARSARPPRPQAGPGGDSGGDSRGKTGLFRPVLAERPLAKSRA